MWSERVELFKFFSLKRGTHATRKREIIQNAIFKKGIPVSSKSGYSIFFFFKKSLLVARRRGRIPNIFLKMLYLYPGEWLLSPPRRLCFCRCLFVCLSVQKNSVMNRFWWHFQVMCKKRVFEPLIRFCWWWHTYSLWGTRITQKVWMNFDELFR